MSSCASDTTSMIEPPVTGARRPALIYLVSALMAEATFFAVLSPLLPEYAHQLHLGKVGVAVLAASYSFGYGVAAIPTGVVVGRLGARAVSIGGLVLVGLSCAVFAVGASAVVLDAARVATGIGATAVWAGSMPWLMELGSDQDRGRLLGLGFSAASAGICLGPVVGALATVISQQAAFLGLAGLIVALGLGGACASRGQAPPLWSSGPESALGAALRAPAARWSLALAALPSLGFGAAGVLLPLRLRALGVQTTTIAAAFVAAAALEVFSNPLVGRWSDRSGVGRVLSLTLIASAGCVAILALPLSAPVLLVALAIGFPMLSSVWLPSLAQLSASVDAVGAQPGVALGLFNICWAASQTVGALGGAQLAGVGEAAPFLALLSLYVWGSAIALRRR